MAEPLFVYCPGAFVLRLRAVVCKRAYVVVIRLLCYTERQLF